MTEAKAYVKQYFPDAYSQDWISCCGIWNNQSIVATLIGEGNTEEEAWEDAKQWIESQPDLMNNFKPE
jgi:hypothetical protein